MQEKTIEIEELDTDELDLIIAGARDPVAFDEDGETTEPLVLVTAGPGQRVAEPNELRWVEWELNMAQSVIGKEG